MSEHMCKHFHVDGAMHIPCYQCKCESLQSVIDEQLLTIKALNNALGGEGSLTTDNLVRIGRLETEIDELRTKLAQADAALKVKDVIRGDVIREELKDEYAIEEMFRFSIQPSQEALDEYVDRIYIALANEARANGNAILADQLMSKCKTELILG